MDSVTFFACDEFWKDVRKLRKHIRADFLECPLNDEEFEKLTCTQKMECIPILRNITTAIKNKIQVLDQIPNNNKNAHHQPFLQNNFIVWKMRWAVDNMGAAYGLRMMYCVQDKKVVFAIIKHKKEVKDDERGFQADMINRLKQFFAYNYK